MYTETDIFKKIEYSYLFQIKTLFKLTHLNINNTNINAINLNTILQTTTAGSYKDVCQSSLDNLLALSQQIILIQAGGTHHTHIVVVFRIIQFH